MRNPLILSLCLLFSSQIASADPYTPSPELASRFKILANLSTNSAELEFANAASAPQAARRAAVTSMLAVKNGEWTSASTELCFEAARNTPEIGFCASRQLNFVEGRLLLVYAAAKKAARANPALGNDPSARESGPVYARNIRFLRNAGIAFGKISQELCEASTMSWWGGTGRGAAFLGCRSSFVQDMDMIELAVSFMGFNSFAYVPSTELGDDVTTNTLTGKFRDYVREQANDSYSIKYAEDELLAADKKLNETYRATLAWYNDANLPTESYTYTYDINGDGVNESLAEIGRSHLTKGQAAWIKYRDAACQAYSVLLFSPEDEHAAYGAMARVKCLTRMTQKQIGVLKTLTAGN